MVKIALWSYFLSCLLVSKIPTGRALEASQPTWEDPESATFDESAIYEKFDFDKLEQLKYENVLFNNEVELINEEVVEKWFSGHGTKLTKAIQTGISYSVRHWRPERDHLNGLMIPIAKTYELILKRGENDLEKFRFKTYSPVAFHVLRELYGFSEGDYLTSFDNETNKLRGMVNPGGSGAFFLLTSDACHLIKTNKQREIKLLLSILPQYKQHLTHHSNSLLPRFTGMHRISQNGRSIYLTVSNFLYPPTVKLKMKYDLKGSVVSRRVTQAERAKTSPTYRDVDFSDQQPKGFLLEPRVYDSLISTLKEDVDFLRNHTIFDYSFFIGVHFLEDSPVMSSDFYRRNKHHAWSGIKALDSEGRQVLLFLGIIDILSNYFPMRVFEQGWKMVAHSSFQVSIQPPFAYSIRFKKMIQNKIFRRCENPSDLKLLRED